MSDTIRPVRTPDAPTSYELIPPGTSSTPIGIAATCPHCDWTVVKPYPRGVRHGSTKAFEIDEALTRQCAQHKHDHLAAYVAGALRTAVRPYGSVETVVQRLADYGLVIVTDPDWKPKPVAEKPVDTSADAA